MDEVRYDRLDFGPEFRESLVLAFFNHVSPSLSTHARKCNNIF